VGLSALRKILPPQPFDVAQLRGRVLAVDADNLIWSFVTAFAAAGAAPPNAHLLGLGGRLRLYAAWGARTVWVFDGAQPELKEATLVARAERIEAARAAGDHQGGMAVTEDDLAECRAMLEVLGVPYLEAPGEAEAQCAHLVSAGHAWAAVTQDWDIALFGAPLALRNLSGSTTRVPELVDLAASLKAAGLSREQLVDAAILIGTDYNVGIHGVGPMKAVRLVKQHGTLEGALAALGLAMPEGQAVRRIFFEHPVDRKFRPRFAAPKSAPALKLLQAGGFAAEPATRVVHDMAQLHER
jgi:flap endonuclease-1